MALLFKGLRNKKISAPQQLQTRSQDEPFFGNWLLKKMLKKSNSSHQVFSYSDRLDQEMSIQGHLRNCLFKADFAGFKSQLKLAQQIGYNMNREEGEEVNIISK